MLYEPGPFGEPGRTTMPAGSEPDAEIVIGLVNLMPKAAMPATVARYQRLLGAHGVSLRCFAADGAGTGWDDIGTLWTSRLDGMIVTGTEPRAERMTEEPAWPLLRELVDWAAAHVLSAVWSCFAAHAAVHRLDGLRRYPLPAKLSGVFACGKLSEHPILREMPPCWLVPHSRLNGLAEAELRAAGYTLLSGGPPAVGVDSFIKRHGDSLFVFLQGHPEYDIHTLAEEYRRDIGRHLSGKSGMPPRPPVYEAGPAAGTEPGWQRPAQAFHAGWLSYIGARKAAGEGAIR